MSDANSVISNDTTIQLDWADVTGANKYYAQVATTPDFSGTLLVDDNTLAASATSYTDSATNNSKRWWRWKYSTDGGSTWSSWSEAGHVWINSGASADVTLTSDQWALIDPDDVTDKYVLGVFPTYTVIEMHQRRIRERNRAGEMLSEYLIMKGKITLNFDDSCYMAHEQMREIRRFNSEIKTFFLANYASNLTDSVPHIWKVEFSTDPELTMIQGRQDLYSGSLEMEEV